jgi:hypothetical protein
VIVQQQENEMHLLPPALFQFSTDIGVHQAFLAKAKSLANPKNWLLFEYFCITLSFIG